MVSIEKRREISLRFYYKHKEDPAYIKATKARRDRLYAKQKLDPEYKAKKAAQARKWYVNNKEYANTKNKERYEARVITHNTNHTETYGQFKYKRFKELCQNLKEHTRVKLEKYKSSNPDWGAKARRKFVLKKYSLTEEAFAILLEKQNGVCAICHKPETAKVRHDPSIVKRLAVDHDHSTGAVRGLLCTRCNTGLGSFYDNATSLQNAIDYLKIRAQD